MRCFNCMNELKKDSEYCPYCGRETRMSNPPHHLAAGTLLNNRYLIGNTIGEGGFGITYVGFDMNLDLKIAVKEYFPTGCATRFSAYSNEVTITHKGENDFFIHGKERFLNEAKNIAKFHNERGIVDVRDYFAGNNTAYIVMEYLEGETLAKTIHDNGVFAPEEIFHLMLPLMGTLDKMHAKDIIHRDISPDNIMYLKSGELKLMDFGSARHFSADESKTMSVLLKPGYAPYEQYSRKGKQGPWTDVYGLCATIYKCITGMTPPDPLDRSQADTLKKPSELGVRISPALEDALLSGMELFPLNRCQSMSELAGKTTDALSESPGKPVGTDNKRPLPADKDTGIININSTNAIDPDKTVAADETFSYQNEPPAKQIPKEALLKEDPLKEEPLKKEPLNKGTDDNQDDSKEKNNPLDKKERPKKPLKRVALILIPVILVVIGLIVALIILSSNKNNESTKLTERETSSQQSYSSESESVITTTIQETTGDEETTYSSKSYAVTNEAELETLSREAQTGDKFSIKNALLDTDGTGFYLSYSDTGYRISSVTIDLSEYKNKNVSVTGTVETAGGMTFWDVESITSNSTNNIDIVINDVSGNVIVPVVNPTVSYNGYKDILNGTVVSGEINVTEYFTKSDLEQWGYNIQLYKTDVSEAESDNDMFTALEGPAKNIPLENSWASIEEKAFAVKIPDDLEPGEYTIYFQQYGDRVGWDSFIKFTAKK